MTAAVLKWKLKYLEGKINYFARFKLVRRHGKGPFVTNGNDIQLPLYLQKARLIIAFSQFGGMLWEIIELCAFPSHFYYFKTSSRYNSGH